MGNLLSLNYWFNARPGNLDPNIFTGLIIFLVLLFAKAIFTGFIKKKQKALYFKIWRSLNSFTWSNFIIGLFIAFFVYEAIYFLSMRFWFIVWFLSMVVWGVFIVKKMIEIPIVRKKLEEEREFKKYIP